MGINVIKLQSFVVGAILLIVVTAAGQDSRPPLLQDIQVQNNSATPSATPLVTKTGSVASSAVPPTGVRTLFPALAAVDIPGYSGILIESLDGNVVLESN